MRYLVTALLLTGLTGCGVEVLTTTAIQGELEAQQLKAMKGQVQAVSESTARVNIRRAIDTYYAEKGYYPLTLDSLVPDYLPSLPKKPDGTPYGYDRSTGKLLDTAAPSAAAMPARGPSDAEKMARIRAAIDRYGQASGYYPPSLQALTPTYLSQVPKTATGQDFIYYPQNGALYVPGQYGTGYARQSPGTGQTRSRQGRGVAQGVGPMGEVMTGMAVQQQLNSMSSSGASAAGSYSRRKLGAHTQQHQQRQQQALDELGP